MASGQVSASLPPEELVAEFVHRLRPFVLDSEHTFFPRVRNVLHQRLQSSAVRSRLELWKTQFSGELTARTFQVTAGDSIINSDKTLRLWLNAFEYHRDEDKREAMASIYLIIPETACRFYFFDLLVSKAEAVLAMADFIRHFQSAPAAGA